MDLDVLYEDFLAYQEARGCSHATIIAYRQDYRRLKDFLAANDFPRSLDSMTGPSIRRYVVWLREQGYKPWSIRRRVCSLKAFVRYCVDEELLERNPAARVPTPKAPKGLPRYLTMDEVQEILKFIDSTPVTHRLRDRALVRVLLFTGLRRSELLGMNWSDIDFRNGTLRVMGKGATERTIPLEEQTAECLGAYRAASLLQGTEWVWCNHMGHRMKPDSLGRVIRRWLRKANIRKDVTAHTWRHTCATLLVQNGAPLTSIQELLGHADISTTGIYMHAAPDENRRSVRKLSRNLQSGSPE